MDVAFTGMMWYWLLGIALGFLPLEIYAATRTPNKADTFSEFVWWVFGVRRRRVRVVYDACSPQGCRGHLEYPPPVKWARFRRFVLAGLCVSLTFHFVLAWSFVPIVIFGAPAGAIMVYAFAKERA